MSEQNQTPGFLDGYAIGEAINSHNGVVCYPAMLNDSEDKYIVKNISVPASPVQLAALLLTGAYATREEALDYYKSLAREILQETRTLNELSNLEGFVPFQAVDLSEKEDGNGFEVSLVAPYRVSLEQIFSEQVMTHQGIMDLAMDLCAALSACRRAGYLYIDLKPGNIFLTENQDYRIGDLGFVSLASLRFASLQDKYRSVYTAPEIVDAYSQLNTTLDVYALGLVLYQAYNGGTLPKDGENLTLPLLPPIYADYEMAEIILTACHPDQTKRWSDPTQLGQALVQYMQRNGVSEELIIPPPVTTPELDVGEDFLPEEEISEQEDWSAIPELAFMQELVDDETTPSEENVPDSEDMEVSEEIEEILAHADELIAHTLPDPVVAPEPIEVPMPDPIVLEPEPEPAPEPESEQEENAEIIPEEEPDESEQTVEEESGERIPLSDPEIPAPADEPARDTPTEEPESEPTPESTSAPAAKSDPKPADEEPAVDPDKTIIRRKLKPIIRTVIILAVLALVVCLAFVGYRNYQDKYNKTVESLTISGTVDTIMVKVVSDADESMLRITCSDTYGNTLSSKVTNGTAIFTGLSPQTRYTIRVTSLGKYKLSGTLVETFTTHSQTRVEDFIATLGPADGSVYLNFRVSGVECDEWILTWSAPGIEPQSDTFAGHSFTVLDLIIGKEYTFTLTAGDESNVVGQTQVTYVARTITRAQDPVITACGNGSLTVTWKSPVGETVSKWTVRCYDDSGYDKTLTTDQCTITFTGLTHETACTVEITAEGMTQSVVTTIGANPINITGFSFEPDGNGNLVFRWEYTGATPEGGWNLSYSCDDISMGTVSLSENQIALVYIPDAQYIISLIPADGKPIFGHTCTFTSPEADNFNSHGIHMSNLQFLMCAIPEGEQWQWEDLTQDDYKTIFATGERAGFVVWCDTAMESADEITTITFVLRDEKGFFLNVASVEALWGDMWYQSFCELAVPNMPGAPGEYSLWIYFDGQFAAMQTFTVE